MPSKQSHLLDIYISSSDPENWPISSKHTNTQSKKKRSASLDSPSEMIKKKFISIIKPKKRANFSLPISPAEWSVLREHVMNEKRFPQYSYNSKTAILTVRTMPPGPLHEDIVAACYDRATALNHALPEDHQPRMSIYTSSTFIGFSGEYLATVKIPDLVILAKDDRNIMVPRIIFEVGLSESYVHLIQSAKLWLEGMPGVQEYILIKIDETPRYKSPSINNEDFPPIQEINELAFESESTFGPVVYKGLRWTGRISTAFYEIWTLDPLTRRATKSGKRMDLLQGEEGIILKLSTLFDVTPDKEITSLISAKAIRQRISNGLINLGLYRCKQKLHRNAKAKKNSDLKRKTISSNITPDTSSPGFSVTNSPPSFRKRPNGGTSYTTKHQTKRHFSIARYILRQAYPGLHSWRILHPLSQKVSHQVFRLSQFSIIHQIGIPSSHWSIDRRSAPQLFKGTLHLVVPGYAFGYNAKPTHQAMKKAVPICSKHSPARLLGVLSLVVSFGNLGCLY